MTNCCVRLSLVLVAAFCCLAPCEQAEGGEFLKRLFGRKCRKVCVPCPQPPVQSVCFGTSPIDTAISVCPTQLVATVQFYNGSDFDCAYQVFLGSSCAQETFNIHLPCDVKAKRCVGNKCCDKDEPNKCENMTVMVDVAAEAMPILDPNHQAWDPSMVPGAKETYKHADLSAGFQSPSASTMTQETVKLALEDNAVIPLTYKASKDGKYYVLNRLTITAYGQQRDFGIGYEVTESHFDSLQVNDISDRLHRGGGVIPPETPPTIPPTNPPSSKAFNFGESDGTNWVWNYNVVEFK